MSQQTLDLYADLETLPPQRVWAQGRVSPVAAHFLSSGRGSLALACPAFSSASLMGLFAVVWVE